MTTNVFVIRDFSVESLKLVLQGFAQRPPAGWTVNLPGMKSGGGVILLDVVLAGIRDADRVIVITDRPNANVGFEAGLALGFGKPTLFAHHGATLPEWSDVAPLSNVIQGNFRNEGELESLVADDDSWITVEKSPKLPLIGTCLELCPSTGEGFSLRRERESEIRDGWIRPPLTPYAISELNRRFDGSNRLVWTIANYPEHADVRDGAENAANAIIAGWFYARCRDYIDEGRREEMPFWVFRTASSRRVVDVRLHEQDGKAVSDLGDYRRRLVAIDKLSRKRQRGEKKQRDARPRVAVLRFENLGLEAGEEAFSDGLTEMLTDSLTRLRGLSTIPKTSVLNLPLQGMTTREIGEKLHAHYLLEGSLDRTLEPCRITVRLIRTRDDEAVWSDVREGAWAEIGRLRSEIVDGVGRHLKQSIGVTPASTAADPQWPIAAREQFMLGRMYLRRFNNERRAADFAEAESKFRRTWQLDPDNLEARVQLAFLYILAWETDGDLARLEASERIWQEVLEAKPDEPFALVESAYIRYVLHGDGLGAIERARRAVAEDLDRALPFNVLALLYLYLGLWESNIHLEKNYVIPRDPAYIYPRANAALARQLTGRYERARQTAEEIRAIDARAFIADLLDGCQAYYLGELDEAQSIWQRGRTTAREVVTPIFDVVLAWLPATAGDRESARRTVERYRNAGELRGPYSPYFISLCALAGETELAIQRIREERTWASCYRYLVTEPTLRSLASGRDFQRLLHERYERWTGILEQHATGLPVQPADVPSPDEFLSLDR